MLAELHVRPNTLIAYNAGGWSKLQKLQVLPRLTHA